MVFEEEQDEGGRGPRAGGGRYFLGLPRILDAQRKSRPGRRAPLVAAAEAERAFLTHADARGLGCHRWLARHLRQPWRGQSTTPTPTHALVFRTVLPYNRQSTGRSPVADSHSAVPLSSFTCVCGRAKSLIWQQYHDILRGSLWVESPQSMPSTRSGYKGVQSCSFDMKHAIPVSKRCVYTVSAAMVHLHV